MIRIVLDTNCLLMSLPRRSPFRCVWDAYLGGALRLCVTTEILDEYMEILTQKVGGRIANNVLELMVNSKNTEFVSPAYRFQMIKSDPDDNKFVDCAVVAGASCIVSNDTHFNELRTIPFPKVTVFSIADFTLFLKRTSTVALPS